MQWDAWISESQIFGLLFFLVNMTFLKISVLSIFEKQVDFVTDPSIFNFGKT